MKRLTTLLTLLLAASLTAGIAFADQTCRVTLGSGSKIGDTELRPGEYKLVVNAPKVRFTHIDSGKTVEFEAKVIEDQTKAASTMVQSEAVDGGRKISEIRIGGSKTRITFN